MQNKNLDMMENTPVNKLFFKFCIPALASNLVTTFYNIVDQIFIGNKIGINGNAATNVVFPAITILTAFSLMCGVGTSTNFNLLMGKGQKDKARKSVGNGFLLMVIIGLIMMIILLFFTESVLQLFGSTNVIMDLAMPYARICSFGFVFAIIGAAGPFIIRADGAPIYALICIFVGTIINIILDVLFIFGFEWGMRGAAWATVLGQMVSAFMVMGYVLMRFKTFHLSRKDFYPDFKLMLKLGGLGIGPGFNFLTQFLVQLCLNNVLREYGQMSIYGSEIALAAAGVGNKVNTIATAVVTGLTNGMQPIVSYNYGRKNYKRVIKTIEIVILSVLGISFVIFACYQLIPIKITSLFGTGNDLYYQFASKFFRVFFMLICLNGLQVSVSGIFSAEGRPWICLIVSGVRQVILLPPLIFVLPMLGGIEAVFWSGPIADFGMVIFATFILIKEIKRLKNMSA